VGVAVRLDYQPGVDLLHFTGLVAGGEDRQLSPKVALDGTPVPLFEILPLDVRACGSVA
jgi:hypothetical protein